MKTVPDWDLIIQKHLDGLTSEDEARILSARIVEDAEIRIRYLKAAQLHAALADETLVLDLDANTAISSLEPQDARLQFPWPLKNAVSLAAGILTGLLVAGMVWAIGSPKLEEQSFRIANGDFESMAVGELPNLFPVQFGEWSGNPAEVVKEASGNKILRFLRTENVKHGQREARPRTGKPNCSVFQLVDLSALRRQLAVEPSQAQYSLKLSARFRRDSDPSDSELHKPKASLRIFLFNSEPESISEAWPRGRIHMASALGRKSIKLKPGDEAVTVSTSCILDSDATVALIAVGVNAGFNSKTSIPVGGYFVDDIQLTVIKQPKLPIQVVSQ